MDEDYWFEETGIVPNTMDVIETEPEAIGTGILDVRGVEIYRMPEEKVFGFIQLKERE